VLDTQQGTGTFIAAQQPQVESDDRARRLDQLVDEFVARAGSGGFTLEEILQALKDRRR
jgi:GntR family transcriptional regulator